MTHSFPSRRSSDLTKADIASPPFLKGPAATDNASPQTSLNKNVICSVVPDDRVAIVFFTCMGFTNRRVSSIPLRKSARYLSRGSNKASSIICIAQPSWIFLDLKYSQRLLRSEERPVGK